MTFNGIHLGGQFGQDRRLIAAAGADFEYALAAIQVSSLAHQSDNIGLADRLLAVDRQRAVVVRFAHHQIGNELLTGDPPHRVEHGRILDPPRFELAADHLVPANGKSFGSNHPTHPG